MVFLFEVILNKNAEPDQTPCGYEGDHDELSLSKPEDDLIFRPDPFKYKPYGSIYD